MPKLKVLLSNLGIRGLTSLYFLLAVCFLVWYCFFLLEQWYGDLVTRFIPKLRPVLPELPLPALISILLGLPALWLIYSFHRLYTIQRRIREIDRLLEISVTGSDTSNSALSLIQYKVELKYSKHPPIRDHQFERLSNPATPTCNSSDSAVPDVNRNQSFNSRLSDLVKRWTDSERCSRRSDRYKIHDLLAELQYIQPRTMTVSGTGPTELLGRLASRLQVLVENSTDATWDWWPLLSPKKGLTNLEHRISWTCGCGEERWADIPVDLALEFKGLINEFDFKVHSPRQNQQQQWSQNQNVTNLASSQQTTGSPSHMRLHQGPNLSSSQAPGTAQQPVTGPRNSQSTMPDSRILVVVNRSSDFKLKQIDIAGLTCGRFFEELRISYYQLRGLMRSWFSVWRYSHCDFYLFEKFDENEFAPLQAHVFPPDTNDDYLFIPKPMDRIPPISQHEFRKRFYSCPGPEGRAGAKALLRHMYHKCKAHHRFHSHEVLDLLPKKKTALEEEGDKREEFWGIYARESISMLRVVVYNLVAILPMLVFSLLWIFVAPPGSSSSASSSSWGSTDLQNAYTPFSIMISMLSLFWSLFLSSLQFGRAR